MDVISNSTSGKYRAVTLVFTVIACMLLGKVTAFQSCGICPAGWQLWEMSCYKSLYPLKTNWQDALESCQGLGANLATPNSIEEYDFLWSTFWASPANVRGVWIGCTDEDGDKVWECNGDTQDVKYRAEWTKPIGDNEKCAVASVYYPLWASWSCTDVLKNVMCERPVEIMTQSATCSIVATDRCLLDHTFKTLIVRGRLQCCLACHKDQGCRSFNLRGNQCEVINSTDAEVMLSTAGSCNHYIPN